MPAKSGSKNDRKAVPPNVLPGAEQTNSKAPAMPDTNLTGPLPAVSGLDTPTIRKSSSPSRSQTKSIMNVSGSSGAVVSNTPEPGLKRIPTVTVQ